MKLYSFCLVFFLLLALLAAGTFSNKHGIAEKISSADFIVEDTTLISCNPYFRGVVRLPLGLRSIGNEAFADCRYVTSVELPFGVERIGEKAFVRCGIKEVILPETVTSICANAFGDCKSLVNVTLPIRLSSIEKNTFYCCSDLLSVHVPEGVTNIGNFAFYGCRRLRVMNMPHKLRKIGYNAFRGCRQLNLSSFSPSIESIGSYAFAGCIAIESLSFPKSISEIGEHCFFGCKNLKELRFEGDAPYVVEFSSLLEGTSDDLKIIVREGLNGWKIDGGGWPMDIHKNRRPVIIISAEGDNAMPLDKECLGK